ncbi:MAG: hypothetical protein AAF766_01855 [Cyanobacteria bacterium P01_D01_bin.14]
MGLLTIFWQAPRKKQIATELGGDMILLKDEDAGEPIGVGLFTYKPEDGHFDGVNLEIGNTSRTTEEASVAKPSTPG